MVCLFCLFLGMSRYSPARNKYKICLRWTIQLGSLQSVGVSAVNGLAPPSPSKVARTHTHTPHHTYTHTHTHLYACYLIHEHLHRHVRTCAIIFTYVSLYYQSAKQPAKYLPSACITRGPNNQPNICVDVVYPWAKYMMSGVPRIFPICAKNT